MRRRYGRQIVDAWAPPYDRSQCGRPRRGTLRRYPGGGARRTWPVRRSELAPRPRGWCGWSTRSTPVWSVDTLGAGVAGRPAGPGRDQVADPPGPSAGGHPSARSSATPRRPRGRRHDAAGRGRAGRATDHDADGRGTTASGWHEAARAASRGLSDVTGPDRADGAADRGGGRRPGSTRDRQRPTGPGTGASVAAGRGPGHRARRWRGRERTRRPQRASYADHTPRLPGVCPPGVRPRSGRARYAERVDPAAAPLVHGARAGTSLVACAAESIRLPWQLRDDDLHAALAVPSTSATPRVKSTGDRPRRACCGHARGVHTTACHSRRETPCLRGELLL